MALSKAHTEFQFATPSRLVAKIYSGFTDQAGDWLSVSGGLGGICDII